MSRPARSPAGVFRATVPFPRMARRSPRGSSAGRSGFAPLPPATRLRRGQRALAGLLGGTLVTFSLVVDSSAQTRIGRLFSSPEQRIELDLLRDDPGLGKAVEAAVDETRPESRPAPERSPPALAVTIDGVVLRGDGHRVAWVNGVETPAGTTAPAGVRVDADRRPGGWLRVRSLDGRTSAVLKPGQTIDVKGRVRDAYEHRSTRDGPGKSGDRATDQGAAKAGEGAPALGEWLDPVSPPALPARLVQELRRGARAASDPPDAHASDTWSGSEYDTP